MPHFYAEMSSGIVLLFYLSFYGLLYQHNNKRLSFSLSQV